MLHLCEVTGNHDLAKEHFDILLREEKSFADLFWTAERAHSELLKLQTENRKLKIKHFDAEETKLEYDALNNKKFRAGKHIGLLPLTANLPYEWRMAFSLYIEALNRSYGREKTAEIIALMKKCDFFRYTEDYKQKLKKVSAWAKKSRQHYPEYVIQSIIDCNVMGGYSIHYDEAKMHEAIAHWVEKKEERTIDGSEAKYTAMFVKHARSASELILKNSVKQPTVKDWLTDTANWALTGTSDLPVVGLTFDGNTMKPMKNKISSSLALSPAEVEDLFWNSGPSKKYSVFIKKESSASRPVIVSSTVSYLRMAYIGKMLYAAAAGSTNSSAYMNTEQQFQFWVDRSTKYLSKGVQFPTDYSNFDRQVLLSEILLMLEQWRLRLHQLCDGDLVELDKVFELVKTDLTCEPEIHYDGASYVYRDGLLSGWFLTSLIGNFANQIWSDICDELNPITNDPPIFRITMGDDLDQTFLSTGQAWGWFWSMNQLKLSLHPLKTLCTSFLTGRRQSTEFLRKTVLVGKVFGYSARTILTICYSNPNNNTIQVTSIQSVAVREISSAWELLASRLGTPISKFKDLLFADIHGATGLSGDVIQHLYNTPSSLGGLGLGEAVLPFYVPILETTNTFHTVAFAAPNRGAEAIAGYWSERRFPKHEVDAVLAARLQVKKHVPWKVTLKIQKVDVDRPRWSEGPKVGIQRPKVKDGIHQDVLSDATAYYIKEKDLDGLAGIYQIDRDRLIFIITRIGWSGLRRLLTGDSLYSAPYVTRWTREFTSMAFAGTVAKAQRSILSLARFTQKKYRESMWYLENETLLALQQAPYTLCG